jgi:hypothetical protein
MEHIDKKSRIAEIDTPHLIPPNIQKGTLSSWNINIPINQPIILYLLIF